MRRTGGMGDVLIRTDLPKALLLCAVILCGCSSVAERRAFDDLERLSKETGYDAENRTPAELPKGANLNDYLRYAALNNPGLEAAFNRWKAAIERVPQARSLPDPRVTYRYFIEHVETRAGPQRQGLGVSQMFPWFGKLGLRSDAALEAANAAREQDQVEKWTLFYNVRNAYCEAYYLNRAIAVVRENLELVKHFEEVVRKRYEAGAAGHQDVIRTQVELGKLQDRLSTLLDLRNPIAARLNAAFNRPVTAEVAWPTELAREELSASDERVLAWLREASPELRRLEHEIAKDQRALELARKDYFPDFTFGLDYIDTGHALMPGTPDSGKDPVIVMVSINVPIWYQKYRAAELEARARLRAATLARTEHENKLGSDAKMILYQFHDAERKIDLYRDTLLPKALQSLKATETAFSSGETGFLDLIDAQRVLLEFQLSYERARTNRAQRLAELEAMIGRTLTGRGSAAEKEEALGSGKGGVR